VNRPSRTRRATGVALLAAALAAPAAASSSSSRDFPRELRPASVTNASITLKDAIQLTLENAPEIAAARLEVVLRRGVLQERRGQFDSTVLVNTSWARTVTTLTATALKPQIAERQFLKDSAENLSTIASQINRNLVDPSGKPNPDCKGYQYFINGQPICSDNVQPTDYKTFQLLENAAALPFDPNSPQARLQTALNNAVNSRLQNVVALIRRVFLPALNAQLQGIGALPTGEQNDTFTLDLRLERPFRSGIIIAPILYAQNFRDNFTDKPDSPLLGGTGIPTLYRVAAGFTADVPLLKGAGATSTAAEERAARLDYEAALHALAQTAADSAFNVTVLYWNLAAAQEKLALYERSAESQRRITELSDALVQGDEMPRSEMNRVRGRAADVGAAVLRARLDVEASRVTLARAMGLSVKELGQAPLAADSLPDAPDAVPESELELPALSAIALTSRADVRSGHVRVASAEALVAGARVDLRPTLDLSIMAGYNAIWEDAHFQVMGATNPTGIGRAIGQPWVGPSAQVGVTFGLPFGNHSAKGRLVQLDSLRSQADLQTRDLERQVRLNLLDASTGVRVASRELASRRISGEQARETISSTLERYRAGEASALEAVQTEQRAAQSLLDVLSARLTLATRVARLRYEAGVFLPYTATESDVSFGEAAPLGLDIRRTH
jgi:outer membrane protein TolC